MAGRVAVGRWLAVGVLGAAAGSAPVVVDAALVRLKAGAAEESVAAALHEARALARSQGRPVRVIVDEHQRAIAVEGGTWRRLPDGVSLAGPPPDRSGRGVIVFAADGSSSGGQVVVWWRGQAASVMVDASSGGVRRVRATAPMVPDAGGLRGNAG